MFGYRLGNAYASWKEITLDTVRVTDTYLDMVLLGEPGIRIEWLAFPEYATYGVVGPFIGLLVNLMRHFYDETV